MTGKAEGTMDLFDHRMQENLKKEAPLAARMRPRKLEDFVGQDEIIGEGRLLRRAIEADKLFSSIILWGPPGVGKSDVVRQVGAGQQGDKDRKDDVRRRLLV